MRKNKKQYETILFVEKVIFLVRMNTVVTRHNTYVAYEYAF